jgi:hypothetical protein
MNNCYAPHVAVEYNLPNSTVYEKKSITAGKERLISFSLWRLKRRSVRLFFLYMIMRFHSFTLEIHLNV